MMEILQNLIRRISSLELVRFICNTYSSNIQLIDRAPSKSKTVCKIVSCNHDCKFVIVRIRIHN